MFGDIFKKLFDVEDEQVKQIVEKTCGLFSEFTYLKESMDELSEWDSAEEIINNMIKVNDFVTHAIVVVEMAVNKLCEEVTGFEVNSNLKLEAAVVFLDKMIQLPLYLEPFDGPAIRILLSQCVAQLNKYLGNHNWDLGMAVEAFQKGIDYITYLQRKFFEVLQ